MVMLLVNKSVEQVMDGIAAIHEGNLHEAQEALRQANLLQEQALAEVARLATGPEPIRTRGRRVA